ncbi:MAG: membrane protein insertion efficiency factor YidD [Desulfuromonas sp.]|nr:MAG: membrane protein insertion efficiency factor YidD [Desulfuromonas sp.]
MFVFFIDLYKKFISPFLPRSCRFYPTCSTYAREALLHYGLLRGLSYTLIRLVKCHPFHSGGYDPLPYKKNQDS